VISTVMRHQVLGLGRQRVLAALLAAMLTTAALAGLLGWSSQHTIVRVFDEATRLLDSTGQPAPPNPFLMKPTLSLLSNMVVYIPLIGALFAVLLGHLSIVEDESAGMGRLLFSRGMSRTQYTLGKIASLAIILASVLAASLVVSVAALLVVNRSIGAGDLGRLGLFYALSWLYLLAFALLGMIAVLMTRSRSLALLSGMGVWLVLTFAVPQFTSGLRPTQSLNPISEPVGLSQSFFRVTSHAQPFSVVEQYKAISGVILDTASAESMSHTLIRVVPLAVLTLLCALVLLRLVHVHDFSRSSSDD
jgi:ABC-type transport system involved in multi-copper enzyme maturation permease subunit